MIRIAGAQEISMQRMDVATFDRGIRRHQRLAQHLPAEHATMAGIATLATKQIQLQALQLQHLKQIGEQRIHCY